MSDAGGGGISDDDDDDIEMEEENKNSCPFLINRLESLVRLRLGQVMKQEESIDNDDLDQHASGLQVGSARVLAKLNSNGLDGDQAPGSLKKEFLDILSSIEEHVIEPHKKKFSNLDKTAAARLSDQLKLFGDKSVRIQRITRKTNNFVQFAKVEQSERKHGITTKFGVKSLCLPSKLFVLAHDLGLDFLNDLQDDNKVYLTYGQYLLFEFGYATEQLTLTITFTNEAEEESQLSDEATDILETLKLSDDDDGARELLSSKIKSLIKRCDLQIALKAGSLYELGKEIERVLQEQVSSRDGSSCKRVSRGLEYTLPPLPYCKTNGLTYKNECNVEIKSFQKIIANLAMRSSNTDGKEPWFEKTVLMIKLDPPVEFGTTVAQQIANLEQENAASTLKEGAVLGLLLSHQGRKPISSNALKNPPAIKVMNIIQNYGEENNGPKRRINLELKKVEEESKENQGVIIEHIFLNANQHDLLPKLVELVVQQTRLNLLLKSFLSYPVTYFINNQSTGGNGNNNNDKQGKQKTATMLHQPHQNKRKRVITCSKRLDVEKKQKTKDDDVLIINKAKNEEFSDVVDVTCTIEPPKITLTFVNNRKDPVEISVGEGGVLSCNHKTFQESLEANNCIPLAIENLLLQ